MQLNPVFPTANINWPFCNPCHPLLFTLSHLMFLLRGNGTSFKGRLWSRSHMLCHVLCSKLQNFGDAFLWKIAVASRCREIGSNGHLPEFSMSEMAFK